MPTDTSHKYVDVPHPMTMTKEGYRYGCWSDNKGPRGKTSTVVMPTTVFLHAGNKVQHMAPVTTEWLPKKCGHMPEARLKDNACKGCENAREAEETEQQDEIQVLQQCSQIS